MRVRVAVVCVTLTGLLAGCVHRPLPQPAPAANPFGYLKRSAVCTTGPIQSLPPQGAPQGQPQGQSPRQSVDIRTRSDDGFCGITVHQEGDAYPSFLLTTLPMHGNSFIYNYNHQTYVNYTADTAYAGPDAFTVSLVQGSGRPRTSLAVTVSVDATGVAVPPAPVAPKPVTKTPTHRKTRHRTVHHS